MKNILIRLVFLIIEIFVINTAFSKDVKIAFYSSSLGYRGTDIALYDYAHFNEKILGNVSYIFNSKNNHPVTNKFIHRFNERCYYGYSFEELNEIILKEGIDIVYSIKSGEKDDVLFKNAKNVIHVVFNPTEPHGDVYALISDWLNEHFKTNLPVVPHMIHLDDTSDSLRKELNIPENAIVFGRHGGETMFNFKFVKEAIFKSLKINKNIWFLFLNTQPFFYHKRIIYLPPTTDVKYKTKFINTCDAMIHARGDGETFGLACGEFSVKNKPIITCRNKPYNKALEGYAECHIKILGEKGIYYNYLDTVGLIKIFNNFRPSPEKNWDMYSEKYNPEVVMKQFEEVFIKPFF